MIGIVPYALEADVLMFVTTINTPFYVGVDLKH
jgi:hypothetical protein